MKLYNVTYEIKIKGNALQEGKDSFEVGNLARRLITDAVRLEAKNKKTPLSGLMEDSRVDLEIVVQEADDGDVYDEE